MNQLSATKTTDANKWLTTDSKEALQVFYQHLELSQKTKKIPKMTHIKLPFKSLDNCDKSKL